MSLSRNWLLCFFGLIFFVFPIPKSSASDQAAADSMANDFWKSILYKCENRTIYHFRDNFFKKEVWMELDEYKGIKNEVVEPSELARRNGYQFGATSSLKYKFGRMAVQFVGVNEMPKWRSWVNNLDEVHSKDDPLFGDSVMLYVKDNKKFYQLGQNSQEGFVDGKLGLIEFEKVDCQNLPN